ncbi:hypothetical protein COW36_17520 [bacterium (Candidatus Blackallbacteria) CG17_big_fil_post_rev_8_21_14_2_50_48_46]|uniref:Uncharacterized protein n=1 Tax=bacterium (Candidatus Blackallbacteria) CG17_big_fil_post_rev_8_21_14_2_50_48_46 TaxID=2014261 RepID=A0A2M7G0H6_9BACT|nr:MAG: hypothetical protein COW64_01210 [bacterium (Candidatus Blackallbacteria) CG18_big_fil_WC_8_21_14_2_50_49_26]PIW15221.1 MAG: hypothetical protein COW36_17520 [bacterium (Candidatus Blackallbacteria) CG17_big_fil_post_rev_8_21_14_2_50_48_46]PIW44808.1 MAG: hypothetical protein COW20_22855 [bacterium (Candidatus Blackallbacteria) CG13_big_fil_rev_8_21_14_2_50_49_14]
MKKKQPAFTLPFELDISYEALARELHAAINRMYIGLAIILVVQYLFFVKDASQQRVVVSAGLGAGIAFYFMGIFALRRLHQHFPLKLKLSSTGLTLGYKRNLDLLFARFPHHRLREKEIPLNQIKEIQKGGEDFRFWMYQISLTPTWQLLMETGEKLAIWSEEKLELENLIRKARDAAAKAVEPSTESVSD